MKLSVSLSEQDVAVVDAYVERFGLRSRSAAVQRAVQMLRHPSLEDDYADAWADWSAEKDSTAWESTAADGFADAAR